MSGGKLEYRQPVPYKKAFPVHYGNRESGVVTLYLEKLLVQGRREGISPDLYAVHLDSE